MLLYASASINGLHSAKAHVMAVGMPQKCVVEDNVPGKWVCFLGRLFVCAGAGAGAWWGLRVSAWCLVWVWVWAWVWLWV